jgi:hypothetical protein
MPSVFLSHSHKDKPFVRKLAKDLDISGIKVWIDEAEIKVGDSLIRKIISGIDSVDYLGIVLSPNSVNSQWVQEELEQALNIQVSQGYIKILPILLLDCEIPGFLRGKLYADFRDERKYSDALSKLIDSIWNPDSIHTISGEKSRLETLTQVLKVAKEVLAVLERQAKEYTASTIPAYLQVELENKRKEVESLVDRISVLDTEFNNKDESLPSPEQTHPQADALTQEGFQLLVGLLSASQKIATSRQRRDLILQIDGNPEEYQLSGVSSDEFAKSLVHHLNKIEHIEVLERLVDVVAVYLPPSLTDRILAVRKILSDLPEKHNQSNDLQKMPIPTLEEIQKYIASLHHRTIESHAHLLEGIGYYFQKTDPSELEDGYIEVVEKLLSQLEFRASESKWPVELREITLDALCLSGEMASSIKKRPNELRGKAFYKAARELGKVLNLVHWRGLQ